MYKPDHLVIPIVSGIIVVLSFQALCVNQPPRNTHEWNWRYSTNHFLRPVQKRPPQGLRPSATICTHCPPKNVQKYACTVTKITLPTHKLHTLPRWHMKDNRHRYLSIKSGEKAPNKNWLHFFLMLFSLTQKDSVNMVLAVFLDLKIITRAEVWRFYSIFY